MSPKSTSIEQIVDRYARAIETGDPDHFENTQAAVAELIHHHDAASIEALLAIFRSDTEFKRAAALDMLTMIEASENHADAILQAAIDALADPDDSAYHVAFIIVINQGDESTIPTIMAALDEADDAEDQALFVSEIEEMGNEHARAALDAWREGSDE